MATRATLLKPTASAPSYLRALKEVLPLDAEIAHAESLPARHYNADAFVREALHLANATREQVDSAEKFLAELQETPENQSALRFLSELTNLYADPFGPPAPIASFGAVYQRARLRPEEVGIACLDLNISRLVLGAVAALRATRLAPQTFAQGCDDIARHEQRIAELHARRTELLQAAADAVQVCDLQWTGLGRVGYAISNGEVPASAPGDVSGMEALVAWLKTHPEVASSL